MMVLRCRPELADGRLIPDHDINQQVESIVSPFGLQGES